MSAEEDVAAMNGHGKHACVVVAVASDGGHHACVGVDAL